MSDFTDETTLCGWVGADDEVCTKPGTYTNADGHARCAEHKDAADSLTRLMVDVGDAVRRYSRKTPHNKIVRERVYKQLFGDNDKE